MVEELSKKERISRAGDIIYECQFEMNVDQLEALASAALEILYPTEKKTIEPGYYTLNLKDKKV